MTEVPVNIICWAGFLLLLLVACIQDIRTMEVSNLVWVGSAAWYLVWCLEMEALGGFLAPILFWLLQELFFSRLYGRADCHAFAVCAFYLKLLGGGMAEYLIHMLLAIGLLALVQLLRHNVNRRGNLCHPVAFMPYITAGFMGVILSIGN